MKRLAQILFSLALCVPAFADEAEVIFTPRLATHRPLTNVLITIRPLSVPSSDGVGEVTVNAITNRTGTSTNYTTTLYTPGTYEISYVCTNPLYRTVFTNDFPNTNGTVYSRDFISVSVNVSGLLAYSKAQSDARFALRTNAFSMISTGGTRLAFGGITNINWTTGVTGYVSGATAHLGVNVTGGSGGSGTGEVTTAQLLVVSNQTQVASNAFRTDISNLQGATNGLASRLTTVENSTNSFAKLTAVVELTNVVNTASNRTWAADNWNTNRVNAGLTNDHSVAVSLKTNLNVSGSNMVRALVVTNNAEIGGNLTAVGFTNTGNTLLTMDFRLSSSDFTGTDTFIGRSGATSKIISKPLYQDLTSSNLAGIHNSTSAGTNFARVFEGTSDTDESALSVSNGYIRGRLNARDITQTNITADRVAVFNSSKNLTNSPGVTTTELEYLDGVTSGIQAQINAISGGSTNAVTNASPTSASGSLPVLTDRVTVTNSGVNIDRSTNVTGVQALTASGPVTNKSGTYVGGAGNSSVAWLDTNTALSVSAQIAHGTVRSNLNLYLPTNGMGGNHAGIMVWTNAGGGTNAQATIAAIGSNLSLSSDGKTLSATGGSGASDIETNIVQSTTNNLVFDFGAANIFRVHLLTNWSMTYSNTSKLTNFPNQHATIYFQQDTNGQRILNNFKSADGIVQTNANQQPTTNANALDVLEVVPGFFRTNVLTYWPQNFQPRIGFTNSLASGGGGGGDYLTGIIFNLDVDGLSGTDGDNKDFPDASGNSYHFTHATSTRQPKFTNSTVSLNNKKSLWFDGGDHLTNRVLTTAAQNYTYIGVFKFDAGVNNFVNAHLMDASTFGNFAIRANDSGFHKFTVNDNGNTRQFAQLNTAAPIVVSVVMNSTGTALTVHTNGVSAGAATAWTQPVPGDFFGIGNEFTPGVGISGILGDQRLYSGALSDANRKTVEQVLGTKFGITVAP